MGLPKSANELIPTRRNALASPGVASLRVTVRKRYHPFAPRFCAASSKFGLIFFKTPEMVMYASGKKAIVCAAQSPTGP